MFFNSAAFFITLITHLIFAGGSDIYNKACSAASLKTFDLTKILNCGLNVDAYSVWIPPKGRPYCARDSFDKTSKGYYTCYRVNATKGCAMIPYTYVPANGQSYLERDIGKGKKSRSIILDTDNCKYLVQAECYPDGSVWYYVTYKNIWKQPEIDAFKSKIKESKELSFLKGLEFKCSQGKP